MHQHESDKDCQINRLIYLILYFGLQSCELTCERQNYVGDFMIIVIGHKPFMCQNCQQHEKFPIFVNNNHVAKTMLVTEFQSRQSRGLFLLNA